jgi:Carbohydrate esterase, sialic acid-specific acetylesterase/Secretion system C-terminal sorting domain
MKSYLSLLLLFLSITSFSQVNINFPVERAVFQRDNNNTAFVHVTGNYEGEASSVEGRLVPMVEGQGIQTPWQILDASPKNGSFTGKISGLGGWYQLQIRTIKSEQVTGVATLNKVGIGEVFIIAGQSNVRGRKNYGEVGSVDDRVNTLDYKNDVFRPLTVLSKFTKIGQTTDVGPFGEGPWIWGELGDKLTNRLNVPVLFLNAAWEGSTVKNWRESAEGKQTVNVNPGYNFPEGGFPYRNLRDVLNIYSSILGVRSIIWQQGETDTEPSRTSENEYASELQQLINLTRQQSSKNISWVIARTSLTYPNVTSSAIINAQNKVISTPFNNTFAGPETDNLQVDVEPIRFDGVHFGNKPGSAGLSLLASEWNRYLSNDFFVKSIPHTAATILPVSFEGCTFDNKVQLKLPENFTQYFWSDGSKNANLFTENSSGFYSAIVKDANNNVFLTSSVNLAKFYPTLKPSVSVGGALSFCEGESVTLDADNSYTKYVWSNGSQGKSIKVTTQGNFSVRGVGENGCYSLPSANLTTEVKPLPAKPTINVFSATEICEGTSINLVAQNAILPLWSTGEQTYNIGLAAVGVYEVTLRSKDLAGCISPVSNVVKATIFPKPSTPEILQTGTFTLEATVKNPLNNGYFEWKADGKLINNEKTSIIKPVSAGLFTASAVENYTLSNGNKLACTSAISGVTSYVEDPVLKSISLFPNPSSDGILSIETKEDFTNLSCVVYTAWGQYVTRIGGLDTKRRATLNLSGLPGGHYIIKVTAQGLTKDFQVQIK